MINVQYPANRKVTNVKSIQSKMNPIIIQTITLAKVNPIANLIQDS